MQEEENERADLVGRLNAAREKKEKIRAAREALEIEGELERKVAEAEQSAIDEAALYEAEQKYGSNKVATCETDMGLIVLKRSNPLMFKRFQDQAEDMTTKSMAILVRPCIVHPDKTRFDLICEELPATLARCANRVAILAGVRTKEVTGK